MESRSNNASYMGLQGGSCSFTARQYGTDRFFAKAKKANRNAKCHGGKSLFVQAKVQLYFKKKNVSSDHLQHFRNGTVVNVSINYLLLWLSCDLPFNWLDRFR